MEDIVSSVDRISDLPNEVITRILSLMSTKEAVPTFMLSKRWNNLWASVPCLKFDYREFLLADDDLLGEFDNAKLIRFINGVLRHRGSTHVDKFELIYGKEEMHPHPAVEWLNHIVLNCKPHVLLLDIFIQDYNFSIPSSVFSCASLEEMELMLSSEYNDIFLPHEVYLPVLKKLKISGTILNNRFCDKLFSGSSLLEKLVLDSCMPISTLQISSSSLKHFAITSCNLGAGLQINTPSLIYLEVRCKKNSRILVKNLMSLINARVIIYGLDYLFGDNTPGYLKSIDALANATTLDLTFSCDVMKESLEEQLFNIPTFINLKTLELGKLCMVHYFDLVAAFLQHSPNLQMLKLFHIESNESNPEKVIARGTLFLKEYLQTVVIDARNAKSESVDLLVKQLRATVSSIGEIQIMKPRSSWLSDFREALFDLNDDFVV